MRSGAGLRAHSPVSCLLSQTGMAIPATTRAEPGRPSRSMLQSANWLRFTVRTRKGTSRSSSSGPVSRPIFPAGSPGAGVNSSCRIPAGGRFPRPRFARRLTCRTSIITRYGTTLIAALVGHGSILVGQVGDGDILLVRPDGSIEFPLPRDPVPAGNETHSISSPDAHLLWRTATLDRGEGGILLAATDGISDSFNGADSEEFSVFVHSLVDRIRTYGMEAVAAAMAGWLDRYSSVASGDDMTLVWACIHPEAPQQCRPEPEKDTPVSAWEEW